MKLFFGELRGKALRSPQSVIIFLNGLFQAFCGIPPFLIRLNTIQNNIRGLETIIGVFLELLKIMNPFAKRVIKRDIIFNLIAFQNEFLVLIFFAGVRVDELIIEQARPRLITALGVIIMQRNTFILAQLEIPGDLLTLREALGGRKLRVIRILGFQLHIN